MSPLVIRFGLVVLVGLALLGLVLLAGWLVLRGAILCGLDRDSQQLAIEY